MVHKGAWMNITCMLGTQVKTSLAIQLTCCDESCMIKWTQPFALIQALIILFVVKRRQLLFVTFLWHHKHLIDPTNLF